MVPLVVKKQNYENAKITTEKEYRAYRKKLAKDALLLLKYPNG
jgi:PHD/YefM family antitoxin component YafN of YafNO toxin-antitoxin module